MKIIFGIPLRSEKTSADWNTVCDCLKETVVSIKNSLVPEGYTVNVLIAGHEKPKFLLEGSFDSVTFIESNSEIPTSSEYFMKDKGTKKHIVAKYTDDLLAKGEKALFMFIDADDLINKYFIFNVVRDFSAKRIDDIAFMRGYVFNYSNKEIGFCNGEKNIFYQRCGSCYISKIEGGKAYEYLSKLNNHSKFPLISESLGRIVEYSNYPGVAYIVNHGANDVNQRRGEASITNLLNRTITNNIVHKYYIEDFGIKL